MQKIVIDGIEYELKELDAPEAKSEVLDKKVGRTYIRQYLGVSNATMSRNPWNFPPPDFGKGLKRREKRYTEKEVIEWLSKPEKIRRRIYETEKRDKLAGNDR